MEKTLGFFLFLFQDLIQEITLHYLSCFLRLLLFTAISQNFHVFDDFDSLRVLVRYFVECPSIGFVWWFSYDLGWGWGAFGRKTTQVKCYPHSHQVKGVYHHDLSPKTLTFLDHLLRQCFSGLPISGLYSLEGRVHNPPLKSGEFHCTSLRAAVPFSSQSPTPSHQAQTILPPRHLSSSCSACPSPSHGLALAFFSQ